MTDEPTSTPVPSSDALTYLNGPTARARSNFIVFTLLACWSTIACLLLYGDDTNSLHTSALAWAFVGQFAVVGSYLFNVAWDTSTLAKLAGK